MGNKLFNKELPHACQYCLYSHAFNSETDVLCSKRGVVGKNESCRKYRYDVTKRQPQIPTISKDYSAENFTL